MTIFPTWRLGGNVTTTALSGTALISGMVSLGNATRTFNCAEGTALVISAAIVPGGSSAAIGITKTGAGTLQLDGSNSYPGLALVNAGTLLVTNNLALGTTFSGTAVALGAMLQLRGVHVGNESLALTGSAFSSEGTLVCQSDSIWDGSVTLTNSVIIETDATLVLNGEINGSTGFTKHGSHTLRMGGAGANTYGGLTEIDEGTLELNKSGGATAIPRSLSIIGSGTVVHDLAPHQVATSSTVVVAGQWILDGSESINQLLMGNASSKVLLTPSGAGDHVLYLATPPSTDARIDLTNNAMVWDYGSASPAQSARESIGSAFANGAWNGVGTTSSTAATTPGTAVGYAESSAIYSSFPATFMGVSVDSTALLFRYTLFGDANLDHKVDTLDFNVLAGNFGGTNKFWQHADFNYDGTVDTLDFNYLAAQFGKTLPQSAVLPAAIASPPLFSSQLVSKELISRRNDALDLL